MGDLFPRYTKNRPIFEWALVGVLQQPQHCRARQQSEGCDHRGGGGGRKCILSAGVGRVWATLVVGSSIRVYTAAFVHRKYVATRK